MLPLRERTDSGLITRKRFQQLYQGLPVYGHHIIVSSDPNGRIVSLHGTKVIGIEADLAPVEPKATKMRKVEKAPALTAADALASMKARHMNQAGLAEAQWLFENEVSQNVIYIDADSKARICRSLLRGKMAGVGGSEP